MKARWLMAVAAALVACSDDGSGEPAATEQKVPEAQRYAGPGSHAPGHRTLKVKDKARDRELVIEVWYPAGGRETTAIAPGDLQDFGATDAERTKLVALLADAPTQCTARHTRANRDAEVQAAGKLPLVAFSHCHGCTRFSSFSVAERLANLGMIVVAPGHAGNTMWSAIDGKLAPLNNDTLKTRAADLRFAIDLLLNDPDKLLPAELRGVADADRVGVLGHSFGSVTAGYVAQTDPRIKVAAGLAAPMQNPLIPGVDITKVKVPLLLMLMREDNSITEFGNKLIRDNFAAAPGPAWKVELDDAGHWSVSDICALRDEFTAGCGAAKRQTDLSDFTYLPVADGIAITARWVGAFFAAHLQQDAAATTLLAADPQDSRAHVQRRKP